MRRKAGTSGDVEQARCARGEENHEPHDRTKLIKIG